MAKWRAIHKKISRSGKVGRLSEFAQFLFGRAMLHTDDWGVMTGDPFDVKLAAIPASARSEEEFDSALNEMEAVGLIWRYEPDGWGPLIQFVNFDDHQPKVLIGNRGDPKTPLHYLHPNYADFPELHWHSVEKAGKDCKKLERERKHSHSKSRSRSKSKSKGNERDSRLDHPAIIGYKRLARLHVPIALRDDWIACAEEVGTEHLLSVVKEWIARGHKSTNISGMMDVAREGWKNAVHRRNSEKTEPSEWVRKYGHRFGPDASGS